VAGRPLVQRFLWLTTLRYTPMVQALTKSGFGPRFDAADRGAGAGFCFW
jgi:hypothetical protein